MNPYEELIRHLKKRGETLSLAESCTGGLLAAHLTDVSGASEVFMGSLVAYSNDVKHKHLGVSTETLNTHGAVSERCVLEMAQGAQTFFQTTWALSISGVAGPSGGTPRTPVGTVCFGLCGPKGTLVQTVHFNNQSRLEVRENSAIHAVIWLLENLRLVHESI